MKHPNRISAFAFAAAVTLAAPAAADTIGYKNIDWHLNGYVFRQQPFPGLTLVQVNLKTSDSETPAYCHFLVKGAPADVEAGKVSPEDVVQMSCQRHYVRTTKSSTYWR